MLVGLVFLLIWAVRFSPADLLDVGGQEDMIEDTAMTMARERGLLTA
ncbi:hypothetical protein [Hydrogenophaga sp. PBL-H3]|nr:hypothetical protein [Hydrogenophaga sp. PBL-H3]